MPQIDQPDLEPIADSGTPEPPQVKAPSSRKSLKNLRRELSEAELKTSAVQKLLIDEIERLEDEVAIARQYLTRFHAADRKAAVLEEKLTTFKSIEIIHIVCITVGGVILGVHSENSKLWILGAILIIAGIVAKFVKLKA
jgi:hypothetical protein